MLIETWTVFFNYVQCCFAPIVLCNNSVLCSIKQCAINKSGFFLHLDWELFSFCFFYIGFYCLVFSIYSFMSLSCFLLYRYWCILSDEFYCVVLFYSFRLANSTLGFSDLMNTTIFFLHLGFWLVIFHCKGFWRNWESFVGLSL